MDNLPIGIGDFYTLKSDSSLRGIVLQTGHDVDAGPLIISERFLVHKDLPDHLRQEIKRTELVPKGYVVLKTLPLKLEILVHEYDLVLIDRYFSRGDVVKKSPLDPQSGTVIATTCSCTLRPSVIITKEAQENAASIESASKDIQITNVDTHELEPYLSWNIGDVVCYQEWIGIIEEISQAVSIQLEDRSVVIIENADDLKEIVSPIPPNFPYVRLDGKPKRKKGGRGLTNAVPCYPEQKVRAKKKTLQKSHWHVGTYNTAIPPVGVVLDVFCTQIDVHWRTPKPNGASRMQANISPKPSALLNRPLLTSGAVIRYDYSRSPQQADGVEDPFPGVVDMVPSNYVTFREATKSQTASLDVGNNRVVKESMAWVAKIWPVAQIISTASRVKVQWQDNSITDESSTSVCAYNEVDDYDLWPGEIVSLKGPEIIQQDLEFEKMLRTRAVGVVQSVNAIERIAKIRWYRGADVTITGEDHDVLVRPHSKLGKVTEEITENSLYELGSYQALVKRRGDLVSLQRPRDAGGQSGMNWVGEVVNLLPNGLLLLRLGALENVQDIKCSVLDLTVVVSADDTTTDSDSVETMDSDEWADDASVPGQWPVSTSIEYEGSTPSDSPSNDEDQWATDNDNSAISDNEASDGSIGGQEIHASMESDRDTNVNVAEEASPQNEPPASNNNSGPASFEILEGSAPKHVFPLGAGYNHKDWHRAVSREHKILRTSLPEGVYARTWESSLELLRVLIVGPSGTPYALAPFLFDIHLHSRFPFEAPKAFFHSWTNGVGRINPNLYEDGKVCLSLLGTWHGDEDDEEWVTGKSTILQIIVSLLGLVLVKEPFYNEAGFEALQGTAQSKPTSAVYSEKAFVLSRGFVATALKSLPAGCADIIEWLYLPDKFGPCVLRDVVRDCQRFLQQEPPPTLEEATERQRLNLERYHIDSPKLSLGILILLRKYVPGLEDLLRYRERLAAQEQEHVNQIVQAMEVDDN
ncbi:MAG: hypothetical protein Q9166_001580 [cf. Caloplaca sp. 2 TL-2023]